MSPANEATRTSRIGPSPRCEKYATLEVVLRPSDEFGNEELPSDQIAAFVARYGLSADGEDRCTVMAKAKVGTKRIPCGRPSSAALPGRPVDWNFAAWVLFDGTGAPCRPLGLQPPGHRQRVLPEPARGGARAAQQPLARRARHRVARHLRRAPVEDAVSDGYVVGAPCSEDLKNTLRLGYSPQSPKRSDACLVAAFFSFSFSQLPRDDTPVANSERVVTS